MGYKLNAQTDTESEYVKSVKEWVKFKKNMPRFKWSFHRITNILFIRFFDAILHSPIIYRFTKYYQVEKRAIAKMHAFTNAVIKKRMDHLQSKTFNEDFVDDVGVKRKHAFLDLLLQAKVDGKPLDAEGIREEVDTFMFEGHDTTTSGISFCLLNIAKHPEVQQRIYEECLEVLDDNKSITMQDLNQLNYLEKVIKESLRIYPSVSKFILEFSEFR